MPSLEMISAIMLSLATMALLVEFGWRTNLGLLAAIYLGAFLLNLAELPLATAVAKLVAGWMAAVILGMGVLSLPEQAAHQVVAPPTNPILGRIFRLLAALLVGLAIASLLEDAAGFFTSSSPAETWAALLLVGTGLLQIGFTSKPFQTVTGLLTVLTGFDLLYSRVEPSVLVAGLLAAASLLLGLVGSYLLVAGHLGEEG